MPTLDSLKPREAAEAIWRAGLAAVAPEAAVRRHVRQVAPGVLGLTGKHEIGRSVRADSQEDLG